MNGQAFEELVGERLRGMVPWGVLSNVPIFRPDSDPERTKGFEIDHLLHLRRDGEDLIVIVECKVPRVEGNTPGTAPSALGAWRVTRPVGERPNIKQSQLNNHAMALRSFLSEDGLHRAIRFEAWLVNEPFVGAPLVDKRSEWLTVRLMSPAQVWDCFKGCVASGLQPQRVEQSALLSRLRLGLRIPELGHPELRNALEYIVRCRRALDFQIFRNFEPTKGRWAINGTAGSGKSVLLAYSLFVVASDRKIALREDDASRQLELTDFSAQADGLGLPTHVERVIQVTARRPKQVEMLERLWGVFLDRYSGLVGGLGLQLSKPRFSVWNGEIDPDCNILVVDEAHDFGSGEQGVISQWLSEPPECARRYLVIACDRHQRLRQSGAAASLVEGLSFSGCTKRLARNYRNPFPVYAAGLGLMFRWFAKSGPKIVPSRVEFENELGMEVEDFREGPKARVLAKCWNDAHPGNNWSHTVSSFPSASNAFDRLGDEPLCRDDVLWVRFGAEELLFDYEKLGRFTYHNCSGSEAPDLIDKYVKGQEFPVVVIEGLPAGFGGTTTPLQADDPAMWQARQMVFLCCSRCTAFLYFIIRAGTSEPSTGLELHEVLRQLNAPENPDAKTRVTWKVEIGLPDERLPMPRFQEDARLEVPTPQPERQNWADQWISRVLERSKVPTPQPERQEDISVPVTVGDFAKRFNVQPSEMVKLLRSWGCTIKANVGSVVPVEFVRRLEAHRPAGGIAPAVGTATAPAILERILREGPASTKGRYLKLCAALLNWRPEDAESVLDLFVRGARKYFSREEEAIWRTLGGSYPRTAVQQIPGTRWYAMVNLARADIEEIASRIMQSMGVPLDLRMKIRSWLVRS